MFRYGTSFAESNGDRYSHVARTILDRVRYSNGVADGDGHIDRQPDCSPANSDGREHANSTRTDRHANRSLRVVRARSHRNRPCRQLVDGH